MHIMYPCEHWKDHVPTPGREALGEISSADTVLLTSSIFALSGQEPFTNPSCACSQNWTLIGREMWDSLPWLSWRNSHHSGQAGVHSPQTKNKWMETWVKLKFSDPEEKRPDVDGKVGNTSHRCAPQLLNRTAVPGPTVDLLLFWCRSLPFRTAKSLAMTVLSLSVTVLAPV